MLKNIMILGASLSLLLGYLLFEKSEAYKDRSKLYDGTLFNLSEEDIEQIIVKNNSEELVLLRDSKNWIIDGISNEDTYQAFLTTYLAKILNFKFSKSLILDKDSHLEEFGFNNSSPQFTLVANGLKSNLILSFKQNLNGLNYIYDQKDPQKLYLINADYQILFLVKRSHFKKPMEDVMSMEGASNEKN